MERERRQNDRNARELPGPSSSQGEKAAPGLPPAAPGYPGSALAAPATDKCWRAAAYQDRQAFLF